MRVFNPITSAILLAMACANVQAMSLNEAVQNAVDHHPEISASRNSQLSADEDVKFARGGYYPSVDLVAGYGRQRSDNLNTRTVNPDGTSNHGKETLNYTQVLATGANNNLGGEKGHSNNDWQAGVELNYNLFRGGSDKARLQSDAHKINQAMDVRNNALRELTENLSLAWNAMNNARKQTPTAREYAETTQRVRAAYQDQFGLGQRTLLDVLDSENELYNANRRYTEVRYTEEFSMYRVLATMGELLSKQRVSLPPEAIAQSEVRNQAKLPDMR